MTLTRGLTFRDHWVPCTLGHTEHSTSVVPVVLGSGGGDFCPFPDTRSMAFDFECYDVHRYAAEVAASDKPRDTIWCHGNAAVARGIREQGVWESYETRLAVELLSEDSGIVLDFGANQGWYSVVAGLMGHHVYAFEMEPETAAICERNMARNDVSGNLTMVQGFVDADAPQLPATEEILLLKSDVEGSEQHVIRCCQKLIDARRVKYMLLEISPCFNDSYGPLLLRLIAAGYDPYLVPDKWMHTEERRQFGLDPVGNVKQHRIRNVVEWVKKVHQANVLMVKR